VRRLLVTGGTGYLGSELVRRAEDAGWTVTGTSSRDFDVRKERDVLRALGQLRPQVVIHTAYRQDGPGFLEINRDGAANVARAAVSAGARLIHVSTDVVFSGKRGNYTEADEPDPITEYGASKADAEPLVRDAHPGALLVRTALIYGGAIPSKHESAARDPSLTFYTDERRNPIQVADLAAALLELAELEDSGILHVAGADAVSRCEFARLIAGDGVRCGPAPAGSRPLDCTLDSSRAQALLRTRLRGCREVLG